MVGVVDPQGRRRHTQKHENRLQIREWRHRLLVTYTSTPNHALIDPQSYDVQPMAWPDHISVYHKFRSVPNGSTDSFLLDVVILSERHQRPAARCIEDLVLYDYRQGSKTPIKEFMMQQFQEHWNAQEEAKARNEAKVRALVESIDRLEKETWDREGAVEDTGGSMA